MSNKKSQSFLKSPFILISLLSLIPIILISFLAGWLFLSQRVYPNISIANVEIGLLTKQQALIKVSAQVAKRGKQVVELELDTSSLPGKQKFIIDLNKQETTPFIDASVSEAFGYGRTKPFFRKVNVNINFEISPAIKKQIKNIASNINQEAISSTLKIYEDEITVTPSQNGLILNEEQVYSTVRDSLNGKGLTNPNLPMIITQPRLEFAEAVLIKNRLDQLKTSPVIMTFEDLKFTLDLPKVLDLLDLENSRDSLILAKFAGNREFNIPSLKINGREISDSKLTLNREKLLEYLKQVSSQIDRPVQEPLFSVDSGSDPKKPRITEFRPPIEGRQLQTEEALNAVNNALISNTQEIKLPVKIIEPKNKLTNELGIKELIGTGISHFAGSIENRKYNIGLASSRINGRLIAPGEEFSFVNTVGDISAASGYKQAYVIKSGRTVLDDGGGVCQVSTTVFRAALNSGLPITARTAHAYRVGYYEQGFPPGLDATVFSPSVDFKFKNDTGHHILIQAYVYGNTLTVDLYGTSDNRTVSMTKPVITNITPAPPEIRLDDPSLPKGTVKQVDFAAAGANVSFSRTVTKGGITYINETFKSNFRPWQAIFLVGTKEG